MPSDRDVSLSDEATFAGRPRPQRSDVSIGDERTLGDGLAGQETIINDIEVVDLEARYKIEGTLGQGGMGAVLLATDTRLDRKVAIKRILGEAAANRMAVQRFLTEAKSIAALNHPNIVQIYDYGRAKDGPFLIMEFVDGGSLLDRCRDGAMPLEAAVDMACQLCDGLAKAHDLGIIHRDIKPANVLLTKDGTPKLTDFGLAKAQAGDHGQTMTGAVLGTPDFMPPEQRRDASLVDHRSDLWSLAATVYQMVTGRSPKIIRFDLLPPELVKVLGKALEDAKESRYQSARELRDAIKAGLRAAAAAPASSEAEEGQCPSCGARNDASRKFCRGCGGSLATPCLSCDAPMPMWEEICGSCGSKQTAIVEARRTEMAAIQAKAEGLLGDFNFDKAAELATRLRDEPHARLSHLKPWAEAFLGEVESSRSHQITRAAESLAEAVKHEQAFDYLSAVFALESIPDAMRSVVLPGAREPVTAILERLKHKQAASRTLEALIKQRLSAKAFDGLLPEVDKLLALQPDRRDIHTLRQQLVQRQQKKETARDDAIATAQSLMANHDYDGALAALAKVPMAAMPPDVGRLRSEAEQLAAQARNLSQEIRAAVAVKHFDGLLQQVDAYLSLKPADEEIIRLRQSLAAREEKITSEINARAEQATQLHNACRFAEAVKVLEVIPEGRRDAGTNEILEQCRDAAVQRSSALRILTAATAGGYADATQAAAGYREFLAASNIEDAEFAAAFGKATAAHDEEQRRKRLLRTSGVIAAAVAAAIILVSSGLWIRSSLRAASIASALESSRWDDALAIDPGSFAAYEGRARDKLKRSPPDIEGAFADIDAAEQLSSGAAAVKATRAWAHAVRAAALARSDKLTEAARDVAEALSLGGDASTLAPARAAIVTAWLARAEKALDNSDVTGLRAACDAASRAGAPDGTILTLRTKSAVMEAQRMLGRGEKDKAVAMGIAAIDKSAEVAIEMLNQAESNDLREALVQEYRRRLEAAVAAEEWRGVGAAYLAIMRLDSQAQSYMPSLPPAALSALPAEAIALTPPLTNSIGIELKLIPAGSFTMGDAGGATDEKPHHVTLTMPFYLGVYELTNAQWIRVMGSPRGAWQSDNHPVESVTWEDALEFCRKLSALPEEQAAGRVYRLPTEAEWEYACRAGTTTRFSFGDDEKLLSDFGWFADNARFIPHSAGQKKSNDWGLYDMHGNVMEWCNDWYGGYPVDSVTDPLGPPGGTGRVCRGGTVGKKAEYCRSAFRSMASLNPYSHGFRLAMSPSESSPPAPPAGLSPDKSFTIDDIKGSRFKGEISSLQAKTKLLEARAMLAAGDVETAVSHVRQKFGEGGDAVVELLKSPAYEDLRIAVAKQIQSDADRALAKKDWQTFLKTTATGRALLGEAATGWIEESFKSIPADAWMTMPAEVIAAIPLAMIASLPSLENSIGIDLKLIPAGSFTMGQEDRPSGNQPHHVTLTKPFCIGVYEVTNAQWKRVMGSVPSKWKDDDLPVEGVSWGAANQFCRKLSNLPAESQAGRAYRLPTEAEWEYACRAGTTTRFSFGDEELSRLGQNAWFAEKNPDGQPHRVGQKKPNPWGLYDMHANAWEWCSDRYGDCGREAVADPQGSSSGSDRVSRGGYWDAPPRGCWSAERSPSDPSNRLGGSVGLRVALTLAGADPPDATSNVALGQIPGSDVDADGAPLPGFGDFLEYREGDWEGSCARRPGSNDFDCHKRHRNSNESATFTGTIVYHQGKVVKWLERNYLCDGTRRGDDRDMPATLLPDRTTISFGPDWFVRVTQPSPANAKPVGAIACPRLGKRAVFKAGDWSGEWVRRGDTNVYECRHTHAIAGEVFTTLASLSADGLAVKGSYTQGVSNAKGSCPDSNWTATLSADGTVLTLKDGATVTAMNPIDGR